MCRLIWKSNVLLKSKIKDRIQINSIPEGLPNKGKAIRNRRVERSRFLGEIPIALPPDKGIR
jgi:hypothetical protein